MRGIHETTQAGYAVCGRYSTFEEGSAVDEVTPVREALTTGTQLGVLWRALFWTFVTFWAPGDTH